MASYRRLPSGGADCRRLLSLLLIGASVSPASALCVGSGCDVLGVTVFVFLFAVVSSCCLCVHGVALCRSSGRSGGHSGVAAAGSGSRAAGGPSCSLGLLIVMAVAGVLVGVFISVRTGMVLSDTNRWDLWGFLAVSVALTLAFLLLLVWWVRVAYAAPIDRSGHDAAVGHVLGGAVGSPMSPSGHGGAMFVQMSPVQMQMMQQQAQMQMMQQQAQLQMMQQRAQLAQMTQPQEGASAFQQQAGGAQAAGAEVYGQDKM